MLKDTEGLKRKGTATALVCALTFCCALLLQSGSALGQIEPSVGLQSGARPLFSPTVAQRFYEIAYDIANSQDVDGPQVEQAIIFLAATVNLDTRAEYVMPEMINLAARDPETEHSKLVGYLLRNYVNESADLEVIRKAISYLLEQLNSREEREEALAEMLRTLGGRNTMLASELATLLGLLLSEKADLETAQPYLIQAYYNNRYNKLAFAKLVELIPDQIGPPLYLEHLRLALRENPLDVETALAFARYAEGLQLYEVAADTYEYCANLYGFLYPSQPLPGYIYLPWAVSSYNTQRGLSKCLQIASDLKQTGHFDLFLEALAGRATAKLGDRRQAMQILRVAEKMALGLLKGDYAPENYQSQTVGYEELAWFYCFASPDANKALETANKAYSIEPNSADAAALLAYSLVMNGQTEWAKPLIDNYEQSQIGDLTLARIQLANRQQDLAIETLKAAVARDPGSLPAERARDLLAEHGSEYIPPADPNIILTALRNEFGVAVAPVFVNPEKIISVKLNLPGSEFSYGSELDAAVVVTNNAKEPLIISDNGLFKGNIRLDAKLSGDMNRNIPNLVSVKVRPSSPVQPGRSVSIPVRIAAGQLRQILLSHPQASLDIELTVYLDPVAAADGKLSNALTWIEPARVIVKRPGLALNSRYLQNRLNALSKGQQGQKTRTAQLITGLLREQQAMAGREPPYDFRFADWMPALLKTGLTQAIKDDDWVVKVHAMAGMVSLSLDYKLVNAVAENLYDTHWPVRLMAVSLLARSQGDSFREVLDWTAKSDSNAYVRQMAVALGGTKPRPQEQIQPESTVSENPPPK
ncbi:MAG: tetratricopeptide repeat protein [Planctomycetota bacterium]|jgi:tetratricopeptide (TPR) repeat protein